MQKEFHDEMTRQALAECFGPAALDQVVAANLRQDAPLNLLYGPYHYDGNSIAEAAAYVEQMKTAPIPALKEGRVEEARAAFGRLTHAVQDYYSHTNYLTLWLEAHPDFDPAAGLRIDPVDPEIMASKRLICARPYFPWGAFAVFPILNPLLERMLPADSHANMNLDYPERGPLFEPACSAGMQRTRIEYDALASRILAGAGRDALDAFCGRGSDG